MQEEKFFAGTLQDVGGYRAYIPNKINKNILIQDNRIFLLLEEASSLLGKLNELCEHSTFINLFTSMHVHLEAISSSEIEGTHADLKELLNLKKNVSDKTNLQKLLNLDKTTYEFHVSKIPYIEKYSIKTLENINKKLFINIKPKNKYAGEIRDFQNYIGGNNIMTALFVPPPHTYITELLNDLNDFWYNDEFYLPKLIKIALYHFQFETIHPFVDGNGRIGRMLINLQLRDSKLLELPILCLSNYWKRNSGLYYQALTVARFSNDIEHWIRFFLDSIINATKERITTIQKINTLFKELSVKINFQDKSKDNYKKLLSYLFDYSPFVSVKDVQQILDISYQAANKIVSAFVKYDILVEISSNSRNREFLFKKYHDIVFDNRI